LLLLIVVILLLLLLRCNFLGAGKIGAKSFPAGETCGKVEMDYSNQALGACTRLSSAVTASISLAPDWMQIPQSALAPSLSR